MKGLSPKLIILSLCAFALIILVIVLAGKAPTDVLFRVIKGSVGSPRAWTGSLKETTPLLIAGLGVFIALRAGLFNIGVEGQLVAGALVATLVGLRIPGPGGIILGALAAMAVGALAALLPAWIRIARGGHEVISTIMLNNIILQITTALVGGPLKGATAVDPRTDSLPPATMLPPVAKSGLFALYPSLLLGAVLVIGFAFWMKKSIGGFELNAVGANRRAAEFAGIEASRVMFRAFLASGALGGLAGAMMVFAHEGAFYSGFSPGYGFDALGVALLAGNTPWGLLPAALSFGLLNQGQSALSAIGMSKGLTGVLLGCLIISLAAFRYREVRSRG